MQTDLAIQRAKLGHNTSSNFDDPRRTQLKRASRPLSKTYRQRSEQEPNRGVGRPVAPLLSASMVLVLNDGLCHRGL